jgi:hypothetical protein
MIAGRLVSDRGTPAVLDLPRSRPVGAGIELSHLTVLNRTHGLVAVNDGGGASG